MSTNYNDMTEGPLSAGLDERSDRLNRPEGHAEDVVNMQPVSQDIEKRTGYQAHCGRLPIRADKVTWSPDGAMTVVLPTGMTAPACTGPLSLEGSALSTWISSGLKSALLQETSNPGGSFTRGGSDHGVVPAAVWPSTWLSDGVSDERVIPNQMEVNQATGDITASIQSPLSLTGFVSWLDLTGIESYQQIGFTAPNGPTTLSIPGTATNANNTNFLISVWDTSTSPGSRLRVWPDEIRVDEATGDIAIDLTNDGTPVTLDVLIAVAPVSSSMKITMIGGQTTTISIPLPRFGEIAAWQAPIVSPGTLESIAVNSITWSPTGLAEVELTNNLPGGISASVDLFWLEGFAASNILEGEVIEGAPAEEICSTNTSVYGMDASLIGTKDQSVPNARSSSIIHHLDSLSLAGEDVLIAGMGGVLHREDKNTGQYPEYLLSRRDRVSVDTTVAPFIWDRATGAQGGQLILPDSRGTSVVLTGVSWNGVAGEVCAEIDASEWSVESGTLGDLDLTGLQAVVTNAGNARFEGCFSVASIQEVDADTLKVILLNELITDDDWDDDDLCGTLQISTVCIPMQGMPPFSAGDTVVLGSLGERTVSAVDGQNLYVEGTTGPETIPAGLVITGCTTSSVINLRSGSELNVTEGLIEGDTLELSGDSNYYQVVSIDVDTGDVTLDSPLEWCDDRLNQQTIKVRCRWKPLECPALPEGSDLLNLRDIHLPLESSLFTRSVSLDGSLFLTDGENDVLEWSGTTLQKAGLPDWQMNAAVTVDTTATGRFVPSNPVEAEVTVPTTDSSVEIGSGDAGLFQVGDRIEHLQTGERYTILSISEDRLGLDRTIAPVAAASDTFRRLSVLRYYSRLNLIDEDGRIKASRYSGSEDLVVEVGQDAAVCFSFLNPPNLGCYQWDRMEIELYRTVSDTVGPYYRVATLPVNLNSGMSYTTYCDATPDESLLATDLDPTSGVATGELGTSWTSPPSAKAITAISSRLVLGNIKDNVRVRLELTDLTGQLLLSDIVGQEVLIDGQSFTFVDSSTSVAAGSVAGDGSTLTITSPNALAPGDWVYLHHLGSGTTFSPEGTGLFQVATATGTQFTVAGTGTNLTFTNWIAAPGSVPVYIGPDGNYSTRSQELLPIRENAAQSLGRMISAFSRQSGGTSLISQWGGEFRLGELVVSQSCASADAPSITVSSGLQWAVNGTLVDTSSVVTVERQERQERVVQSYPNFPSLFDSPGTEVAENIQEVRDISSHSSGGVTALIPLIATSIGADSQVESLVVAAKEDSIHVFRPNDPAESRQIETGGIGVYHPRSISHTGSSLVFSSRAGVYALYPNLQVSWVGEKVDRRWESDVKDAPRDWVTSHVDSTEKQWIMSYSTEECPTDPSLSLVANSLEQNRSWFRFEGMDATWWSDSGDDRYFGTPRAVVMQRRDSGECHDWRDENRPVESYWKSRPIHFGAPTIRKSVLFISSSHTSDPSGEVTLESSTDLSTSVCDANSIKFTGPESVWNLRECEVRTVLTSQSITPRRGQLFQAQWSEATIDSPWRMSSVTFRVAGLTTTGISQAGSVDQSTTNSV